MSFWSNPNANVKLINVPQAVKTRYAWGAYFLGVPRTSSYHWHKAQEADGLLFISYEQALFDLLLMEVEQI